MNHHCTLRTEGYCAHDHRSYDRQVVDDFLTARPGEGLTADEYTALLLEEEAHRENQQREEDAA